MMIKTKETVKECAEDILCGLLVGRIVCIAESQESRPCITGTI
jgi:hypothetical protein